MKMLRYLLPLALLTVAWPTLAGPGDVGSMHPSANNAVLPTARNNIMPSATTGIYYAATAHNETIGSDGVVVAGTNSFNSPSATFTSADVGKTLVMLGLGSGGADLIATIASVTDAHHVVFGGPAATYAGPYYTVGNAIFAITSTVTQDYAVNDTLTVSGGTGVTTAGTFSVVSLQGTAFSIQAAGTLGTPGTCTVTGTTGVTRVTNQTAGPIFNNGNSAAVGYFQLSVTISGGGAISSIDSITWSGDYTTPPTSTAAEPVTGCGLSGAAVAMHMAPHQLKQSTAGIYGALPANSVSVTGGSGVGATLTLFSSTIYGQTFNATPTQVGGLWAYGTDDTAAIQAAMNLATTASAAQCGGTVVLPAGRSLVLGALQPGYTGTAPPIQCPLTIKGAGNIGTQTAAGHWVSYWGAAGTGTELDLHYAGASSQVAKFDTRGMGYLEFANLTLEDWGTDNYLFVQTTGTTLVAKGSLTVMGNPTAFWTTNAQDAIRFGGITSAASQCGTNAATDCYQGYGSQLIGVNFDHVREAVQLGGAANSISIINPIVSGYSGSNKANGAPFVCYGLGNAATSDAIIGGDVEVQGYPYAFSQLLSGSGSCGYHTIEVSAQDANMGFPSIGYAYSGTGSQASLIAPIYYSIQLTSVLNQGAGAAVNVVADTTNNSTVFPRVVTFGTGVGLENVWLNGGTGSGQGSQIGFGTTNTNYIGNYSAIFDGTYSSNFALKASAAMGLYGGVTDFLDYSITTFLVATLPAPTTLSNATVKLSGLAPAAGANQVCSGTDGLLTTVASGTACASSAMRYKLFDSRISGQVGAAGIDVLDPIAFRYKDAERLGDRVHVGLRADDVRKMDPRCVVYVDGKLENYEDRCVLAYAVAAIQELRRENVALRAAQAHARYPTRNR